MIFKNLIKLGAFIILTVIVLTSCKSTPVGSDIPDACNCEDVKIAYNIKKLGIIEQNKKSNGNNTIKIALIGDMQLLPGDASKIVDAINQRNDADMVFVLGDLTDQGLAMEFDMACKNLKKLRIPFFPVIGNHDALSFGKDLWLEIFGPYDFSFSLLNTNFIAYNSNKLEFPQAPSYGFIQSAALSLTQKADRQTFMVAHVPPDDDTVYSSQEKESLYNLFHSLGVKHTIYAHTHGYSLTYDQQRDIHQFIVTIVEGGKWGMMTITPTEVYFEKCSGINCSKTTLP